MSERNEIENIDNSDVIIPEIDYIDYVDREVREYLIFRTWISRMVKWIYNTDIY